MKNPKFNNIATLAAAAVFCAACDSGNMPFDEGDIIPDGIFRPVTDQSSANIDKVFEWLPAPGQFINHNFPGLNWDELTIAADVAEWAKKRLDDRQFVSLGAFGGYIVTGFDHSIVNTGGYEIGIIGNAFISPAGGSNEPGIVYVMMDENGNGLPDDTWYELVGSRTFEYNTVRNYSITYIKPEDYKSPVKWIDNFGDEGEIPYLGMFHPQSTYYPFWVKSPTYTLSGTCLGDVDRTEPLEWGYADNMGADCIEFEGYENCNRFRISDAIDMEGNKVDLPFIDFVKVQTGVNAAEGWLGEISTEVMGIIDLSLTFSSEQ